MAIMTQVETDCSIVVGILWLLLRGRCDDLFPWARANVVGIYFSRDDRC
jgi:hypothetical protein